MIKHKNDRIQKQWITIISNGLASLDSVIIINYSSVDGSTIECGNGKPHEVETSLIHMQICK